MQRLLLNLGRLVHGREQRLVLVLVLVMFLGGAAYALHLGNTLPYPDERDFFALATNLAHSGRFTIDGRTPTAYRAPGYPLVLAMFVMAGGSLPPPRLLHVVALA